MVSDAFFFLQFSQTKAELECALADMRQQLNQATQEKSPENREQERMKCLDSKVLKIMVTRFTEISCVHVDLFFFDVTSLIFRNRFFLFFYTPHQLLLVRVHDKGDHKSFYQRYVLFF